MLTIDRLRLRLPASYRDRANEIALLVGKELCNYEARSNVALDHLALSPIEVVASMASRDVARAIASAITVGIDKPRSQP